MVDKVSTIDLLSLYNRFDRSHPFVQVTSTFDSMLEAARFPLKFVEEFMRLKNAKILEDEEQNTIFVSQLLYYSKAIQAKNLFGVKNFDTKLYEVISKDYYRLIIGEITLDQFSSWMTSLLNSYKDQKGFNEFWQQTYISKISKKNKFLTINRDEITGGANSTDNFVDVFRQAVSDRNDAPLIFFLNDEDFQRDQLLYEIISQQIESGDIRDDDENLLELIIKFENGSIPIPVDGNLQIDFDELDKLQLNLEHPHQLKIEDIDELIKLHGRLLEYCKFLFKIDSIGYINYIGHRNLSGIKHAIEMRKMLIQRINKFRDFFFNSQKGIYYFEGNPYAAFVEYYFLAKKEAARTRVEKELLVNEIEQFYDYFHGYAEVNFLDKFIPLNFEDEELGNGHKNESPPAKTELNETLIINGYEVQLSRDELIRVIAALCLESDIDALGVTDRLVRDKIWNDQVIQVIRNLSLTPDNLELVNKLVKGNPKRIIPISDLDQRTSRGGDRVIIASKIDDGKGNDLCALIFVVEFTDKVNQVELLVRKPEEISVKTGQTALDVENAIDFAIAEERKQVQEIPKNILDFLRENILPDFDFDFETQSFPDSVAFYIAYLLSNNPTYRNQLDKTLIEEFLKLCIDDSKLKEAIVTFLAELIEKRQINIHFGSSRHPEGIFSFKPRIIARNIFNYLARKETNSASEYKAFTDEAKVIFEGLGTPDKNTATKEWILKDSTRIHFCYVNEKLEIAITWNYHH